MAIPKHSVPITRAQPASNEGRLLDITGTSRDAETLISRRSRNPYNPDGPAKIPTGRLDTSTLGEPYGQASPVNARTRSMGSPVPTDDEMQAWSGSPFPSGKGVNSANSGHPTKNARREVGGGGQPKAKR